MKRSLQFHLTRALVLTAVAFPLGLSASAADEPKGGDGGWTVLIGASGADGTWKSGTTGWADAADTSLDPENPRRLAARTGAGVFYNGTSGRAPNLISKEKFGDVEVHMEFMVPKGSNSGVKLEEVYEIQIFDSYGVAKLTASHCGGIYPRAELLPRYHHIDEGYPPKVNACRPPGEWQSLDITFHAPKFDAEGKKVKNAVFDKVLLNGQVVQENQELPCPTGNNWRNQEHPTGSLLLQGDHGPVAFRNVRVRPAP
jgi:hypothetical protein